MTRIWQYLRTALKIIFRHPITGTSIIPILPDGRIVLVRRRDNGCWGFPGGIVDWGEDVSTSVRRELAEETGLQVIRLGRLVGIYSSPNRDPRFHSICIAVEAEVEGSFRIQDTDEISDVQAFSPGAIPQGNLTHDHDRQLQDYFAGATRLA
jgi:8-oxo-dGTP diphosphatase